MAKGHKEALQEFTTAVQALNAAGAKYGANSTQVDTLMSEVISKLGFALGAYKAMHIAGQISPGSAEEKEYRFLVQQMQMIVGQ